MSRRCRAVEPNLTALADGQLRGFHRWRVQRHVAQCDSCRSLAESLAILAASHAHILPRAIALDAIDTDTLRRRVRIQIAALPDDSPTAGAASTRGLRPVWAVAMAMGVLLVSGAVAWQSDEVAALLVSLGLVDPPSAVARETELFRDYSIIRNLDALENYDDVESVPLDGSDQTSEVGMRWAG